MDAVATLLLNSVKNVTIIHDTAKNNHSGMLSIVDNFVEINLDNPDDCTPAAIAYPPPSNIIVPVNELLNKLRYFNSLIDYPN